MKPTIYTPVITNRLFLRTAVLVLLSFFSTLSLAVDYYVVNRDVEVYSAPDNTEFVSHLSKGKVLLEIDKKGSWSRVFFLSADKKPLKGWIPSESLTAQQQRTNGPVAVDGEPFTVAATSLRLRKGPGAEYAVVGLLAHNQAVSGLMERGEWIKVAYRNGSGEAVEAWTARRFLRAVKNGQDSDNSSVTGMFRVVGTQVNYRSGPGLNYPVVGRVSMPQQVEVSDGQEGWYKIVSHENGASRSGWILKRFLEPVR